jgi:predicted O-methyltransferase YrrM
VTLEEVYDSVCSESSDINEHLPTLRKYAEQSSRILELGTRYGTSTTALLAGQPDVLISLDVSPCRNATLLKARGETDLRFVQADSLEWEPSHDSYHLLFVDTLHTFEQVTAELARFAPLITGWIILHDTVSFPPVMDAVREFLTQHPEWSVIEDHQNNNGLIILERRNDERMD